MYDSFYELIFPEIYQSFILIDNVPYIPIETMLSTLGTLVVSYGLTFGAAFWLARELFDLFKWFYLELRYRWSLRQKFEVTDKK